MKNRNHFFGMGNIGRVFGLTVIFAAAMVSTAFAESITKTFEFGAGTANSISNKRTFSVPCGVSVSAVVEHYRLGDVGAENDVLIVIELKKPGATADEEGTVADTQNATAKRTKQTATVTGTESNRGCSLPWIVRVKPANGQSQFAIKGSIVLTYSSAVKNISVEGGLISLNKGNSVTKNIGGAGGLEQGTITVTANWNHAIGPVPGPLPVKLKFELISPDGVVKTVSAYSSNEARSDLTKFKLTHQVTDCASGQWKIRITNNTNDDTMNIDPKVKFTPDCPN
jgi:hypothetical protein